MYPILSRFTMYALHIILAQNCSDPHTTLLQMRDSKSTAAFFLSFRPNQIQPSEYAFLRDRPPEPEPRLADFRIAMIPKLLPVQGHLLQVSGMVSCIGGFGFPSKTESK